MHEAFAVVADFDHGRLVGRVGDGLADMDVVKTFALVVDGEVEHDVVRNLDELEVGVVFNVAKVGVQRVDADVDLTGLERDKAGGLFLDQAVDNASGGSGLAVEVVGADEGDLVAGRPGLNGEHAGADLVAEFIFVYELLGEDGHTLVGQEHEEVLRGLGDGDGDVGVVDDLDVRDELDLGLREGGLSRTLEGELDVVGGAGRAVGEGHVLGNFEREGAAVVRGGPGRGHAGDDFVCLGVDLNQRLMRQRERHHVGVGVGALRVQRGDVVGDADGDGILIGRVGRIRSGLGRSFRGLGGSGRGFALGFGRGIAAAGRHAQHHRQAQKQKHKLFHCFHGFSSCFDFSFLSRATAARLCFFRHLLSSVVYFRRNCPLFQAP